MRNDLIQLKSNLSPGYDPHEERQYNLAQAFIYLAKEIKNSTERHEKSAATTIPVKLIFPIILSMFVGFLGGSSIEMLVRWFTNLLK